MNLKVTCITYVILITGILAVPLTPSETFTHKLIVDDDKSDAVQLFWKVVNDEIIFEVHAKTTGWIGVGISPNGGMAGSDIAIGWIDDKTNKAYLRDTHAESKDKPIIDKHQDWFLLDGSLQIDDYTIIKMKRKLQTCDEQDQDIIDGSTWMIFAWHKDDPKFDGDWSYHGDNRRTKTALLMDFKENSLEEQDNLLPADTKTFDIHASDALIPSKDTYYYCELFKLPVFDQDMHMVQFEVLVNQSNKDIVHHYDVYECDDDLDYPFTYAEECYANISETLTTKCGQSMIIAWSIGGQYTYTFPKVAGYPLIKAKKSKHIVITIHYDNYKLSSGRMDNSGIRFFVSPTLRKYDLGLMNLGNMGMNGALSFTVPPYANEITFSSVCYPECMNLLPDSGIQFIGGMMHTHLLGKSVRASLVRNNKIISNLLYNPNYDFNYQYLFDIKPLKVEKGDMIITECTYTSKNYSNFTFIGASTREEMCNVFAYYYPANSLALCGSAVDHEEIKNFYKSLVSESLIPKIDINETNFKEQYPEVMKMLKNEVKGSKTLADRYTKFFESRYLDKPKCRKLDQLKLIELEPRIRYVADEDLTKEKCRRSSSAMILKPTGLLITIIFAFKQLF